MKHFYPNGTIVTLTQKEDTEEQKVMIVGRGYRNNEVEGIIDYLGFVHPYGFAGETQNVSFQEEAIQEVIFLGYEDEVELEYKELLKENYKS